MVARRAKFRYAGVRVRDLESSIRFYSELGLRIKLRGHMEHGGEWVHMAQPYSSMRLELNFYPKGSPYYEPFRWGTELDHLGFVVDDTDAWVRRLKAVGGKVVIPAFNDSGQRLAFLEDPNGICVEIFSNLPKRAKR